jgi:hypothetical protein
MPECGNAHLQKSRISGEDPGPPLSGERDGEVGGERNGLKGGEGDGKKGRGLVRLPSFAISFFHEGYKGVQKQK